MSKEAFQIALARTAILVMLLVAAAGQSLAQGQEDLLGRWVFVQIVDEQGRPDQESNEAGALIFSETGIAQVEPSQVVADQETRWVPFRIVDNYIILTLSEGDEEFGEYHFEGDTLVIVDHLRGLTTYLRR